MTIDGSWRQQSDETNAPKLIFVSQFCCRCGPVC